MSHYYQLYGFYPCQKPVVEHSRNAEEATTAAILQALQIDMSFERPIIVDVAHIIPMSDSIDDRQVDMQIDQWVLVEHSLR